MTTGHPDNIPSGAAIWLEAARPRTLPAAVAPVIVGTALAYQENSLRWLSALLCLVFALLAQIAANFANDYFDFVKGADTRERKGPRRAVASGLVKPATMLRATILVCALAFMTGLCLLPYGGWPLLVLGIASLLSAVAYTGGPYPLAYHGLGDLFVFLFFGLVAVTATAFVQCGSFQLLWLVPAAAVGGLAANILVVNNYRDVETDATAGKKTLVVRFGRGYAKAQFLAALILAMAAPVVLALTWGRRPWSLLIILPLLLLAGLRQFRTLRVTQDPNTLIQLLGKCGQYLAAYAVLVSAWVVLG